jgi:hypothetical protein
MPDYPVQAQVSAPASMGAYGGNTLLIETMAVPGATNKTRVFVATASANSVFYADVDHALANPFGTNLFFRTAPGLDASGNHGTPSSIAAHAPSSRLFVGGGNNGLLSCTTNADSFITNYAGYVGEVLIQGAYLFFTQRGNDSIFNLRYGTVSADGIFTENAASPCQLSTDPNLTDAETLAVHPTNNFLYIAFHKTNLFLKSSTTYDAFSAATTFSPLGVSSTVSNWLNTETGFRPLTFGPDGRMFLSSYVASSSMEYVVYSDDDGVTWSAPTATGGGAVTKAVGSADSYTVYSGRGISTNKGVSWADFGSSVPGTRVWTGTAKPVVSDPYFPQIIYCTTEGGVAVTTNSGVSDLFDISRGIEALTITDFDVTISREVAWIASRGVYRATNFSVAPQWSTSMWPGGDVICRSIGLDQSDTSGSTVYVGGFYLYKTTNAGGLNGTDWARIFAPTNFGLSSLAVVTAVKASGNTVFAGCYGPYDGKGGLFRSTDGGSNWIEVTLHAGGVDVNDILLTEENGVKVAYVAVARDDNVTAGSGLYRYFDDTVSYEVSDPVSIRKIAVGSSNNIYASGLDANTNVVVYQKVGSTTAWIWRTLPLTNYPTINSWWSSLWCGGLGPVITIGLDSASNEVPYMTANEYVSALSTYRYGIYYLASTSSTWQTSSAMAYPVGSQIYVIYWDDLVVGTSIGLYGQAIQATTNPPVPPTASTTPLAADFDGDAKADPAVFNTNSNWKIKLSNSGYTLLPLTGFLGSSGATALAADFDGDRLADPAVYYAALELWAVKLSSLNYLAPTVLTGFGGTGWQAVADDFDGDRLADPALYNTNGTWKVKLSTAGYTTITSAGLLGFAGWTGIAADLDGDGKADPTIYQASTGSWIVLMSSVNYAIAVIDPGFLGSTGYTGLAADFDGDRLADPTVSQTSTGNWKVKLSSGNYTLVDLPGFLGE